MWAFVAVTLPITAMLLPKLSTIDLAYQVRAGNIMLETHQLLSRDLFTFTAGGHQWVNQQWGAEVIFALLYRVGGWPMLIVARALLSGAIFWLVYAACRLEGADRRLASFLTLGSFGVSLPGLILRPQILGLVLFALSLFVLAGRRRRPGVAWALIPLVALWANIHGSFFLGPVLAAFAFAEDRLAGRTSARRTGLVAVAAAAAATLNPYGIRAWSYALGISTNKVITNTIVEWRPPTVRTEPGLIFFLSVAGVVLLLSRRSRAIPWVTLAELAAFGVIGLFAVRGIYWWALAVPVILAPLLPDTYHERLEQLRPSVLNSAIVVLMVFLILIFLPWWRAGGRAGSEALLDHAPAGITRDLRGRLQPGERVFDPQIWGSWFEFAFPAVRVFDDSRIELFPVSVWNDYDDVSGARQGWEGILDRWGIDVVVASRLQQGGLIPVISGSPRWRLVYSDSEGVVAVRR